MRPTAYPRGAFSFRGFGLRGTAYGGIVGAYIQGVQHAARGGHFVADGAITHSVFAYLPAPSIKLASIAMSVLFLAFGDNLSQLIVIPSGQAHGLLRGTVLLVAG